jgi:hypothetical protein
LMRPRQRPGRDLCSQWSQQRQQEKSAPRRPIRAATDPA